MMERLVIHAVGQVIILAHIVVTVRVVVPSQLLQGHLGILLVEELLIGLAQAV